MINARDASESSGKIEVGCERRPPDAERQRPEVMLWVRDHGRGMDTETRAHLFDPFFTTKAPGQGTGLGMARVRSVVEEASGRIEVVSEPGRGTTVTIHLPEASSADERAPVARPPAASVGSASPSGHRVLVVEDDPDVLTAAVRAMERGGFEVVPARDGDRAIEIIEDPTAGIDVLCIDGVIPGARAVEVIERTRARRPEARIILCTGYVDEDLLRRGIRTGELACVRKPYTSVELLARVRAELGLR